MNKEDWHYDYWEEFREQIYKDALTNEHLVEDGKVHHQPQFYQIIEGETINYYPPETEDTHYVKLIKGKTNYILPTRFLKNNFPIKPKKESLLKIHLRKNETIVWNFITEIEQLTIPKKAYYSLQDTIKNFNPLNNTNTEMSEFLKIIAFVKGIKLGICANVGAGKNSNLTLMRSIRGKVSDKVKNQTEAKFYQTVYYNDYINLDEITTWKKDKLQDVEELLAGLADDSPNLDKFSKDSDKNKEIINKLNKKSITFTFNPVSNKNPNEIQDNFKNFDKIEDRYPLFDMEGQVTDSIKKPNDFMLKETVKNNFKEMCMILSNDAFWEENYSEYCHYYDKSLVTFERRHKSNLSKLIDFYDAYCLTQEEFNFKIKFLMKCYRCKDKKEVKWDELNFKTKEYESKSESALKIVEAFKDYEEIDMSQVEDVKNVKKTFKDFEHLEDKKEYFTHELNKLGFSDEDIEKGLREGLIFTHKPDRYIRL